MWNDERPLDTLGIEIPDWIEGRLSPSDIAAICQGGCASGAYMPAVTYHKAMSTMGKHGDDVIDFIDSYGDNGLPTLSSAKSWAGICCDILSYATELWAHSVYAELEDMGDDDDEDDDC